jgi:hypothetical protein
LDKAFGKGFDKQFQQALDKDLAQASSKRLDEELGKGLGESLGQGVDLDDPRRLLCLSPDKRHRLGDSCVAGPRAEPAD